MKKSRFTDSQIIAVLKHAESGAPVPDLPGAGVEPAHQAQETPGTREAAATVGARDDQPGVVDGLHARPAQ